MAIMRKPLDIPFHLIKDAQLYSPTRDPLDAVCYVLSDYPRVVADARQMRSRLAQMDREAADLDQRLEALQEACRQILDL
tara:strand:+ start:266 stop:505 length:240 start_codon:yes stop_codon:yes gene_type:complete